MTLNDSNPLLKVLDHKSASFLKAVAAHAQENGTWTSSGTVRLTICDELEISTPTYFRYVNILVNKGILMPSDVRGLYTINQEYHG